MFRFIVSKSVARTGMARAIITAAFRYLLPDDKGAFPINFYRLKIEISPGVSALCSLSR